MIPNVPHLFQRGRRPDQQTRSVRTGNDEQADHDQGKSEGGEERALSCSAEDPGETGGEGEIWSKLRRYGIVYFDWNRGTTRFELLLSKDKLRSHTSIEVRTPCGTHA